MRIPASLCTVATLYSRQNGRRPAVPTHACGRTQITLFGRSTDGHAGYQIAAHIGGSACRPHRDSAIFRDHRRLPRPVRELRAPYARLAPYPLFGVHARSLGGTLRLVAGGIWAADWLRLWSCWRSLCLSWLGCRAGSVAAGYASARRVRSWRARWRRCRLSARPEGHASDRGAAFRGPLAGWYVRWGTTVASSGCHR
jgi:hypothetical protein